MNKKVEVFLTQARRDWSAAEYLATQGQDFSPQVCFLAQQAAEKGLKAVLAARGEEPPRTHDLEKLAGKIPESYYCAKLKVKDLKGLTEWAVKSRYPTPDKPPPSKKDADIAFKRATRILISVEKDLAEHSKQLERSRQANTFIARSRLVEQVEVNPRASRGDWPTYASTPEDWLTYARRDLAAAEYLATQGQDFSPQVCFLAQQAAEKGLKAILAARGEEPPRTHWAVKSRYPTRNEPPPSKKDAGIALWQARTFLASVEQDFEHIQQHKANERVITDRKSINYLEQYMNQKKPQITSGRESGFDLDY